MKTADYIIIKIIVYGMITMLAKKKIYPDSVGLIIESMLFDRNHTDTCFFFLLRNEDVKNHSWDEIRNQKLYGVWIITKNKDGKYKRNIKKEDIITY
jgi:hypothetical protein